jgi:hypothetical protein
LGTQANGRDPAARKFPGISGREMRMLSFETDQVVDVFTVETYHYAGGR